MQKILLKRIIILGFSFLFLGTIAFPGLVTRASSLQMSKTFENSFTAIGNTFYDEKPDLIIVGLGTEPSNNIYQYDVYCIIKNIGSKTVNDFIDVKVEIKRVFFGVFLINKTLRSFFANCLSSGGLPPNETTNIEFAGDYQLPAWGFYRIYCQVNPDKRVDETDYNNNFYTKDVLVLFGDWVKAL